MPRIFDNIDLPLLPALEQTLAISERADFCVGYFNLRGWRPLDGYIDEWAGGPGSCCRLLVGMQKAPGEEFRDAMRMVADGGSLDNSQALRMKLELAEEFKTQITLGFQTNADEAGRFPEWPARAQQPGSAYQDYQARLSCRLCRRKMAGAYQLQRERGSQLHDGARSRPGMDQLGGVGFRTQHNRRARYPGPLTKGFHEDVTQLSATVRPITDYHWQNEPDLLCT
jgi:hypothetical protein